MRRCPNPDCPETALLGSPAEYRDEIDRCPTCGTVLTSHSTDVPADGAREPDTPVFCAGVFRDLAPALNARAALNSQGFPTFLADEHTIAVNWGYSQALRGIKLIVFGASRAEVEEALAPVDPASLKALPEMQTPPTRWDACPKCGSEDLVRSRLVTRVKALSFWFPLLILAVPLAARYESLSCRVCGHAWRPKLAA